MFCRNIFFPEPVALRGAAWSHASDEMMTEYGHNEGPVAPMAAARKLCLFDVRLSAIRMADKDEDDDTGNGGQNDGGGDSETGVVTRTKPKTKKPAMYKVIMLNDDYTPMEFVILVLERFFSKNHEESTQIMLHVHQKGVGVCGVFTYEVAETKVQQVMDLAQQHQHPLQCTLEKA
ncbi:MAG: ATP-dependent Clp protease adaptor protein ClpS [Paracoccaceae bacterium]|jgi:ATP-dependent Clp protease adaptor protein ClpS